MHDLYFFPPVPLPHSMYRVLIQSLIQTSWKPVERHPLITMSWDQALNEVAVQHLFLSSLFNVCPPLPYSPHNKCKIIDFLMVLNIAVTITYSYNPVLADSLKEHYVLVPR